ncbi:MAG TPA: hypothetical protein VJL82_02990 [Rhizomicrobium sp.]|nr:hypothetical protein [Rhizomicrobium sp.]
MKFFRFTLVALSLLPVTARGQEPSAPMREQALVAQFLKTCFDTKFSSDAVIEQASAGGWKSIDPKMAPLRVKKEGGGEPPPVLSWKTDSTPDAFIVFTAKTTTTVRPRDECGVAGFDLDSKKVIDLLTTDGRFKNNNILPPGASVTMLHFDNGNLLIGRGNPSAEEKAAGHTSETVIQIL